MRNEFCSRIIYHADESAKVMLKLKRALLSMKPTNVLDYPDQYSTKVNALQYL